MRTVCRSKSSKVISVRSTRSSAWNSKRATFGLFSRTTIAISFHKSCGRLWFTPNRPCFALPSREPLFEVTRHHLFILHQSCQRDSESRGLGSPTERVAPRSRSVPSEGWRRQDPLNGLLQRLPGLFDRIIYSMKRPFTAQPLP